MQKEDLEEMFPPEYKRVSTETMKTLVNTKAVRTGLEPATPCVTEICICILGEIKYCITES